VIKYAANTIEIVDRAHTWHRAGVAASGVSARVRFNLMCSP